MSPYMVFVLIPVLFGLVAAYQSGAARRLRLARQRLDLLQQALERPDLDAETRRHILAVLTSEHEQNARPMFTRGEFWQRLSFGIGWLLFMLFGGIMVLGLLDVIYFPDREFVVPMALVGLALMTLPRALRELQRGSAVAGTR